MSLRVRRVATRFIVLVAGVSLGIAALHPVEAQPPPRREDRGFQGEHGDVRNIDARRGPRAPSDGQRAAAAGRSVRWNQFGTPRAVFGTSAPLAQDLPHDPEAAARRYLADNADLFGLSAAEVAGLELVATHPVGRAAAVLLRQRFAGVPSGHDGLVTVGVVDGSVVHVSSSLAPETRVSNRVRIDAVEALQVAAADVGFPFDRDRIREVREEGGWTLVYLDGTAEPLRARATAVPTPLDGARHAWETLLLDPAGQQTGHPTGFTHFVDADTSDVLLREDLVDHAVDNPEWEVFPAYPPLDYASTDTRERWCWIPGPGCDRVVGNPAATLEWDVDPATSASTETSRGNGARTTEKWFSNVSSEQGTNFATPSATRTYAYPYANEWFEERCNPDTTFTSPRRNDIDAAIANLFVGHNRMHDWSYRLGFTETAFNLQTSNLGRGGLEGDPEHGNAQAGGVVGGPPGFRSRDNANQITPPDGVAPTTNMYLWQPIAGGFYAPCVDGDFDMTVIGHEYTHAISNRMVAGPDERLRGLQANAMGESWSDLVAMEILNEYGMVPVAGESPYAIGAYVTRDPVAGIRNYNMSDSPLNYSNVGYDLVGPQVHADGEIWSATNFDIRRAMNDRYGAGTPALQRRCADGEAAVDSCPGNRRWIQLVFDAWLLMAAGEVTMVEARDAMLAADMMRFGGANQDLLWNAFARRGLGESASSSGASDSEPVPSFESPHAEEGALVFKIVPEGDGAAPVGRLFVGDYEARVTPVADTDPGTGLPDTVRLVPGTYDFVAHADGYGAARLSATVRAGDVRHLPVPMPRNLASVANGASASGEGINHGKLIDDTEGTNWASLASPVAGRQVTVRLDPSRRSHLVGRLQVSAMLRPREQLDPGGDTGAQNRFSALRQFEILVCEARGATDCSTDANFRSVYVSPPDAFPSVAPRPRAPDLILRSFPIPPTRATHVRLRVLANQCTGGPDYQGDQDDDPRNVTDCDEGSMQGQIVRVAELQVFTR